MPARPRLLYLVHRVPYPPNRGDRIRSYHFLRNLSERFEVSLATLADEPVAAETRRELDRLCEQVAIEPLGRSRWLRAAASLAGGKSATEGLFASPALGRTVQSWAANKQFDAALVFCSSMVQYLDYPQLNNVPAVVDLVDVDSQKWFDYGAKTSGLKRMLFDLEGRRLRQLEMSLPARTRAITLVSDAEANLYRGFCSSDKIVAVPNGVDLDYFRPAQDGDNPWADLPPSDRCQIVFVGALDYRANIDAVTWFAAEVWPAVRSQHPELELALVGREPVPAVRRLAEIPGIRVFANVPDVRPHLAAAKIVIAPLRIARGIQNKVLEAMAMAKPVICSPAALEGLTAQPNTELQVAATSTEWIESVCDLIDNEQVREQLGSWARDHVARVHAWSTSLKPLFKCFDVSISGSNRRMSSASTQKAPTVNDTGSNQPALLNTASKI
jgi:sugar transferase (PEP-CTERM/EpsH1 system associated)